MSTPKESSRQAARFALRLDRRTHNHHLTSYRENGRASSSPARETSSDQRSAISGQELLIADKLTADRSKLSWEQFPDDRWPSDAWVVGADIDPACLPDLWMFLAGGEEVRDV